MSAEPLIDAGREQLIAAIEDNMVEAFRDAANMPGVEFHVEHDHYRFSTGIDFPFFNQVQQTRLADDVADERIDEIVAYFRDRNVSFFWATGPATRPTDVRERLTSRGFTPSDMPGMAVSIDAVLEVSPSPELVVRSVEDAADLDLFTRIFMEAFGLDGPAMFEAWRAFVSALDPARTTYHIGWVNGSPVATSLAYRASGVVGLYNVGTVPAARGRGYGAAMTVRPLVEAHADGYRIGILHASGMGAPVYRRLGFEELCTVGMSRWVPTASPSSRK